MADHDTFPPASRWSQKFSMQHDLYVNARTWRAAPHDQFQCIACFDVTGPRSDFEAHGFACGVCRDGVLCLACSVQYARARRRGEIFNTVRCPACRNVSYTYACLSCSTPRRPGGNGTVVLVKEFIGVDERMVEPILDTDTLAGFVDVVKAVMRMVDLQIRVRATFSQSHKPCVPSLLALNAAVTRSVESVELEDADEQQVVLREGKTSAVFALWMLWPLLRWTYVVGAVCSDPACCTQYKECAGCGFFVRATSAYAPAGDAMLCGHCTVNAYTAMEEWWAHTLDAL